MMCPHVDPAELTAWLLESGAEENTVLVRQTLQWIAQCPACRTAILDYFGLAEAADLSDLADPPEQLGDLRRQHLARLRLDRLFRLPPEALRAAGLAAITDAIPDSSTASVARRVSDAVEAALERARDVWLTDAHTASRWLTLAEILLTLSPDSIEERSGSWPSHACLTARVAAYRGNAQRVSGDLTAAARSFAQAEDLRQRHGECFPPSAVSELCLLHASFLRATHQLDAAFGAVEDARRAARAAGDLHAEGRGLLIRAYLQHLQGDYEASLADVERASTLVDTTAEPRLAFVVAHNRVHFLTLLERFDEAAALLPEATQLAQTTGVGTDRFRLRWSEAKIAEGIGDLDEAERLYREVRQGFIEHQIGYDVALVSLELSRLLVRRGRPAEVQRLCSEVVTLMSAVRVQPGILAAVMLWFEASQAQRLSVALLDRLHATIRDLGSA